MKFLFICLLVANAVVFALWQGLMMDSETDASESQRLSQQENSQYLKLISAKEADTPQNVAFSCLEWGEFQANEVTKAESMLIPVGFGNRQSRQAAQDAVLSIVYIPPLGSQAAAEKKAQELKDLGVTDFFVIQDSSSSLRWAISLGVFKSEEAAKQLLAKLVYQGVRSAKLGTRTAVTNMYNLVFSNVSSAEKTKLDKLKAEFPGQDLHGCET